MRLAAGGALLVHGVAELSGGHGFLALLHAICAVMGLLLLVGLWTPIVAAVGALTSALHAFMVPADAATYVLLGTLAASLALLGPGVWSIDARLFGWRRVEIRDSGARSKGSRLPPE